MQLQTELKRTKPGERPEGEGWRCIVASASYGYGRWWLWTRTVTIA